MFFQKLLSEQEYDRRLTQSIPRQMIPFLFKYVIRIQQESSCLARLNIGLLLAEFCEPISSGNRATYLAVGASIRRRQQSCKLHILSVIKCIADTALAQLFRAA